EPVREQWDERVLLPPARGGARAVAPARTPRRTAAPGPGHRPSESGARPAVLDAGGPDRDDVPHDPAAGGGAPRSRGPGADRARPPARPDRVPPGSGRPVDEETEAGDRR